MNSPTYQPAHYPRRMGFFMSVAWALIAVKCTLVWWAMIHWNIPFHPVWIVAPTVVFAALATILWLTHHED